MSHPNFLPPKLAKAAEANAELAAAVASQVTRNKTAAADILLRIRLELSRQSIPPSIPGKK
jgi:hypothetical protein